MTQNTLKSSVSLKGIGLHSGEDIEMTLIPARENTGIIFIRTDLTENNIIPAFWNRVVDTQLCTVIGNEHGASVGTIEHLMAALRGCGIDNLIIKIDGPEVPAMDGSSAPFVKAIERAGTQAQDAPRRYIKILKDITIEADGKKAALRPAPRSAFGGSIDFDHPEIGRQTYNVELINGNFIHDIADARTFGFLHEVEYMRKNGMALGGSLDNAIVLDQDTVMNDGGLRYRDEFIRHKLLDAIGDLYLAGAPILGAYEGKKAGHALNNELLHALFADMDAWTIVDTTGAEIERYIEPSLTARRQAEKKIFAAA